VRHRPRKNESSVNERVEREGQEGEGLSGKIKKNFSGAEVRRQRETGGESDSGWTNMIGESVMSRSVKVKDKEGGGRGGEAPS